MRKVKLIVHETYQGKRKSEDIFAAVFLSNAAALTPNTHSGILLPVAGIPSPSPITRMAAGPVKQLMERLTITTGMARSCSGSFTVVPLLIFYMM